MIWLLIACTSAPSLDSADSNPFHAGAPRISEVSVDCSAAESEWIFEVRTENWTGGGWIWVGKSETDAEGHKNKSRRAAADGSSDFLQLKLKIEADWRDAKPGSSTRWLCRDWAELSFMATAFNPKGEGVEDCRTWGADPTLWTRVEGAYDCENEIDIPIDTGL
tara:strand:+ start:217 stop:708 length:492 start_codon:yes stop_codon:yes gene_type:complete